MNSSVMTGAPESQKLFKMDKEILRKYLTNCCSEDELSSIIEGFEKDPEKDELKKELFLLWEELPDKDFSNKPDFELILDRIHHHINLSEAQNMSGRSDDNTAGFMKIQNIKRTLLRVAAIMLLPLLIYSLFMTFKYYSSKRTESLASQSYNEVFSSIDAITRVTLPDGSNVWLNHSSSLRYPSFFRSDKRTIELTGEGFFEVVHNSKVPFIVKAGDIEIMATGTTFNVLAYPGENRIETSLINGNVEIMGPDNNGKRSSLLKMKSHDLAIYQISDGKINTFSINDDRYYSWKDGKLIFSEEPLGEVIKKLRRWYNVDIQAKDPEILDLTLTATFVHESLPQVMELLAMIIPINYSISSRQEINNGTFTKRMVILSKRKN
jgi:ferric-dicitrate binding protein FerR (iron transport regulator)